MDDFDREVYCLAGLPFDAVDLQAAVCRVRESAADSAPCFISTPNLNFLVSSLKNRDFRHSVIQSDLVLADGMPLVWMAKLLGIPFPARVAGSDLFEELNSSTRTAGKLSVFFFGGMPGVAENACQILNSGENGLVCAGFDCPGFGTVAEMSGEDRINKINSSGADFLIVSLGAVKGQHWIMENRGRITVPVISHLGAVVNFVAGTVSRAPRWMQRSGLEWLWRIKEEPSLLRRYWYDGTGFVKLLFLRFLPYAIWMKFAKPQGCVSPGIESYICDREVTISFSGVLAGNLDEVRVVLRQAASAEKTVVLDLAGVRYLDSAFLGYLLLLEKHLKRRNCSLRLVKVPNRMKKVFYWNGLEYLLAMP